MFDHNFEKLDTDKTFITLATTALQIAYKNDSHLLITFCPAYTITNKSLVLNNDLKFEGLRKQVNFSPILNYKQLSFGMAIKFPLRSHNVIFSHIELKYTHSESKGGKDINLLENPEYETDFILKYSMKNDLRRTEYGEFHEYTYRVESLVSDYFDISSPLFSYESLFSIGVGIRIGVNRFSYSNNYIIKLGVIESFPVVGGRQLRTIIDTLSSNSAVNQQMTTTVGRPILTINLLPRSILNLDATLSYDYLQVGTRFTFSPM